MQFDNIEYFAKTKQNVEGVQAYISLTYVMKPVKQCTCTFRVCSFTVWFSLLKYIKNDRKIQDMGAENGCVYVSCRFFYKNKHDYKCDRFCSISSISNTFILRDLCFRHHIACFCSIPPTKKNPNSKVNIPALFYVSEEHDSDSFLN